MPRRKQTKDKSKDQEGEELNLIIGDPKKPHPGKAKKPTKEKPEEQEVPKKATKEKPEDPDKVDMGRKPRATSRTRKAPLAYRDEDYESPKKSTARYVDCIYFV